MNYKNFKIVHHPETIKEDWNTQTGNTGRILAVPCFMLICRGGGGGRSTKHLKALDEETKFIWLTGEQRCSTGREGQAGTLKLFETAPRQHSSSLGKR